MNKKSKVFVVGADYHGDWTKDIALTFQEAGVDAELLFTNTVLKGTDNNTDASRRAQLEKIKRFFRNYAKPVFKLVKEQRRLMTERNLVKKIRDSRRSGQKLFVIFIWTPPSVSLLKRLKKIEGITLVMWQGEAPVLEARWRETFPYFDHFLIVGESWKALLDEEVQKKTTFVPLASSPKKFFPLKEIPKDGKFVSDIAFVGYYYPDRARMLAPLKDHDLRIYGYWWENGMKDFPWAKDKYYGPLSNEDANFVFNEGKIQVGRSLTQEYTPYSTSITQRVFDVSLANNFQLSGYSDEIEKIFGDAVPMFRTPEELKEMVDYYLAHPEERKRLAAKAHEITINGHTYEHRIKTLIDLLGIER